MGVVWGGLGSLVARRALLTGVENSISSDIVASPSIDT
jgi:hypothetical protein